jgi:hypothetical protein
MTIREPILGRPCPANARVCDPPARAKPPLGAPCVGSPVGVEADALQGVPVTGLFLTWAFVNKGPRASSRRRLWLFYSFRFHLANLVVIFCPLEPCYGSGSGRCFSRGCPQTKKSPPGHEWLTPRNLHYFVLFVSFAEGGGTSSSSSSSKQARQQDSKPQELPKEKLP